MIDLLSMSQVILKEAGYAVRLATIQKSPVVCFEDGAVLGFCATFESPIDLIKRWPSVENEILVQFAPSFRAAGEKAWNVYCVLLCDAVASGDQRREIGFIEENLERTRKIAESGVSSRDQLIRALLPVLPIQHRPVLLDSDATTRLKKRIRDISPKAEEAALDPNISASEVARLLGERP
jgi:hypothetical protein